MSSILTQFQRTTNSPAVLNFVGEHMDNNIKISEYEVVKFVLDNPNELPTQIAYQSFLDWVEVVNIFHI